MKAKIYIVLLGALILTSCKDYLDLKNSNAAQVPTSIKDLQDILDDFGRMNELRTPSYAESAADNFFIIGSSYNSLLPERKLLYRWEPFDYYFPTDWGTCYLPIYNSNFCLEGLAKINVNETNEKQWNNVYGSAHFYRAYYYLQLLWTYSAAYDPKGDNLGRGIVLRKVSDINIPNQFSTIEESYKQVIDDAHIAVKYLDDLPLVKARPSKAAAYALLARTYLSMGKYSEAGTAADASLRLFSDLMDYNNPSDGVKITATVPFTKFTKETIFYSEMNQRFQNHTPGYAMVDSNLMLTYEEDDLRRKAFFVASGKYYKFKGTYSHSPYWMFSGMTSAEMLLVRAESNARAGNISACLADVNLLLKHRWDKSKVYKPKEVTGKVEALNLVLKERRKELLMRGIRLSDVKRLNLEGADIVLVHIIDGERIEVHPNSSKLILGLPTDVKMYLE
ncbi:RagB/SusD family nutrient uptake outer membrane protein [Sphingobacterium yanglingense]|nr:RagB/SusD family nutrient uptake outer membrane protein [Sphingobacterium yanglingense]